MPHIPSQRLALALIISSFFVFFSVAAAATAHGEDTGIKTRGRPGDAICRTGKEIPSTLRKELRKLSDQTFGLLKSGDTDALWKMAAPNAHDQMSKEVFAADMKTVAERIGTRVEDAPAKIYAMTFDGEYDSLALCGAEDPKSNAHRAIAVASKGEDVVYVLRNTVQPPFTRVLALAYRKVGTGEATWRLSSVHASAVAFHGKTHEHYLKEAEQFGHNKALARLLVLEIALAFSKQAPYVSNRASYEIGDALKNLMLDAGAVRHITRWRIDGEELPILQVTVVTTRTGLRPQILYLTEHALDSEKAAKQARAVGEYVRSTYPQLGEYFGDMVIEGVAKPLEELKPGFPSQRIIASFKSK